MSCKDFAAALVDEQLPPPPGLQAHLAHCEDCRALARLQVSAQRLRLPEPPLPSTPVTPEAILGVVRRRQRRRRVGAAVGATCAVLLLVLAGSRREVAREPMPPPESPLEGVLLAEAGEDIPTEARREVDLALASLVREVEGYSRTRPALEDRTYDAFGLLALWVRPPESRALESEPFRTALWAFQSSR